MEKLVGASDLSDCSVQGVFLQESPGSGRTFPFPCYLLDSGEKMEAAPYPSIYYPDVLNMVFEADTIIS